MITTLEVNESVEMTGYVPDLQSSDKREPESLGQGNNSKTIFRTRYPCIIDNTVLLVYGDNETEFVIDTHYSVDLDYGKIILTQAGIDILGTQEMFIYYKYNKFFISDSSIVKEIERLKDYMETEIGVSYDGFVSDTDIVLTDYTLQNDFQLPHTPVVSIESIKGTTDSDMLSYEDISYDLKKESGLIHTNDAQIALNVSYTYGKDTMPAVANKLLLSLTANEYITRAVARAYTQGMDDFKPQYIKVKVPEIEALFSLLKERISSKV